MPKPKKIVFTGGHASATAYALIQYIKPLEAKWNFFWIGPKSFIEGKRVKGLENQAFKNLGVKVLALDAGRIQRKFTRWTIPSLLKIPLGFVNSFNVLRKIKPDLVLSFGGFVGFPVVVTARILRIPVIIHEQTSAAGRGNIVAARFASKIAISRKSSMKYFPEGKTVLTGNPVDPQILKVKPKDKMGIPPILFITGGHTGASRINKFVLEILERLLVYFNVVHQTGNLDFIKFQNVRNELPLNLRKRYNIYRTISSEKWPEALGKADIVLSRSGANIVSQLLVVKRPALLVPLPFSYLNEQYENALYAKNFGIAQIMEERELSPTLLLEELKSIKENWGSIVFQVLGKKSPDFNSSHKLYLLIKSLL
jgi:UDP-N-acetylglucosamine--N-acetylmuramyl-(pentapeptide) pyrophosphoryl-undecaprenol N-acetylglucosamine transferase